MHDQPNPEKILQTGLAFWASKTLLSAIEMGLFTELSRGPETFESISGRLGLHPRGARLSGRAGRAGFSSSKRRSLWQYAGNRPLSRSKKTVLHRRHPRDGESQ